MGDPGQLPLVRVEGLSKRFGRCTAVEGFGLTLHRGEICGFVGPNGTGKSTALRLLAGLLRPDAGSGTIVGCDVARLDRTARCRIGYLPQRSALYGSLSLLENLRFRAAVYGMPNPIAAARRVIALAGLGGRTGEPLEHFSGGWQRRAALAATLIHDPGLLLFDEPTTGVDDAARAAIWDLIAQRAANGIGVVFASHDRDDLRYCTRIVAFEGGRR
jgi:ABC-2 type transport system ATP-binding protein